MKTDLTDWLSFSSRETGCRGTQGTLYRRDPESPFFDGQNQTAGSFARPDGEAAPARSEVGRCGAHSQGEVVA